MIKKILLRTGLLFLRTNSFSKEKIFLKKDLDIALEKHLVCIHDNLEKIINKEKIAKLNDNFYDLNKIIERYNFINDNTEYINMKICKKYTGYVVNILENMGSKDEDVKDWETNYSKTALRVEINDIINFKKGKDFKNDFSKNKENENIEKEIELFYNAVIKEENEELKNKKDITSDRNIFKD